MLRKISQNNSAQLEFSPLHVTAHYLQYLSPVIMLIPAMIMSINMEDLHIEKTPSIQITFYVSFQYFIRFAYTQTQSSRQEK